MLCVSDCVLDCVCPGVPEPPEWEHIGNQIDAATIFAQGRTLPKGQKFEDAVKEIKYSSKDCSGSIPVGEEYESYERNRPTNLEYAGNAERHYKPVPVTVIPQ